MGNAAAAPATVSDEPTTINTTGVIDPGKVVEGNDPRARKPATSHGHARKRRAGCPEVSKKLDLSANWGEGQKVRQHVLTVWMFAVENHRVSSQNL
jgi:hypothetical protein